MQQVDIAALAQYEFEHYEKKRQMKIKQLKDYVVAMGSRQARATHSAGQFFKVGPTAEVRGKSQNHNSILWQLPKECASELRKSQTRSP